MQFRTLLRHPSVWYKIFNGIDALRSGIEEIESAKSIQFSEKILLKYIYGFRIYLHPKDIISWGIGKYGYYEPFETEVFRKTVKEGMNVIDVGANIGYYSLMAAKLVKTGKVYAFEPEENNYSLLLNSIRANNFRNIMPIQQCASNENGYCTFFVSPCETNLGGGSMVWDSGGKKLVVPSITLDTFAEKENVSTVNVLKIDVEGAEPLVLMGARKILTDNKNLKIFLEYNPSSWNDFDDLLNYLFQTFDVYEIVNSPFLLRKIKIKSLPKNQQINLFLKKLKSTSNN